MQNIWRIWNQLFLGFDRYERVVSSRTIGIYSFFRSTKNGEEEIKYDLDACEEYLEKPTELPFTKSRWCFCPNHYKKGGWRFAKQCKKQKEVLIKWNPNLWNRLLQRHDATILEKIWKDWEAFASYAFNKSHSTCYAWIAYQTAI
jgi:DNA polymerase-3 subunit alpha